MNQEAREFRPDFGVYVCTHVFNRERPVRWVVRDEPNSWQFLCGFDDPDKDPCHVVGVGHLLERDPSLSQMAELPEGFGAERSGVGQPWTIAQLKA